MSYRKLREAKNDTILKKRVSKKEPEPAMNESSESIIEEPKIFHPISMTEAKEWTHTFWSSQPILGFDTVSVKNQKIVDIKTLSNTIVPESLSFYYMDLSNIEELKELLEFLNENYVENTDSKLKAHITAEFLLWSIGHGLKHQPKVLVIKKEGKIIGSIIGRRITMRVHKSNVEMAEVNYLCVHSLQRTKNISVYLMEELRREFSKEEVESGFFGSYYCLPSSIIEYTESNFDKYINTKITKENTIKTYHRPLNYKKLLKVGFVEKSSETTEKHEYFKVKLTKMNKNIQPLVEDDIPIVYEIYLDYMGKYSLYQLYDYEEFKHYVKSSNYVNSFVYIDSENNIYDFFSYNMIEKVYIKDEDKILMKQAQLSLYTCDDEETSIRGIVSNAIRDAYNKQMDVFSLTNIGENYHAIMDNNLLFIQGGMNIYYNFYNWECSRMRPSQIFKSVFI